MLFKALHLKIVAAVLVAAATLAGCGYHAVTLHGPLAEGKSVNVVLFTNKSFRAGLEGTLGREIVDEFALRTGGNVQPREKAQYELSGVITSYGSTAVSYTSLDTIKEYRVAMTVQATLRDQQTQKVLWKGDLTEEQTYPVNTNLALQQNAEEAAAAKICRRLSEDLWLKIGEAF